MNREEVLGRTGEWLEEAGYKTGSSERKHRLQIRLTSSTLDLVEQVAAETGESCAEAVRTLVQAGMTEFNSLEELAEEVEE